MANIKGLFDAIGNAFNFSKPAKERMIWSSNPDDKTLVSEVSNILEGAWSDYTGQTANQANIDYQKEYNDQVFNRADTQYQRTVADLRAAGLSSQLAAGSPSTVAGSSSAPQRTVGNESEAIEKLIGMITSMKQTNANVALASAQADKAKAEADRTRAEIPWVDKLNDAQYMTAIVNKDYTIAMTRLKMLEGDNYVAKVQADIKKSLSEVNKNNKLIDLYNEQISLTSAQEGKTQAERREINQRIENLKQEEQNLKQDFENKVLSGVKITAETELILQKAATAAWDLFKSQQFNLRSGDTQTKFSVFGSGWNNSESMANSGSQAVYNFIDDIFPEKFVPQNYIDMVNSWGTSK